jgi:RNA polymerase sigma-70 factor, ECF subfamily
VNDRSAELVRTLHDEHAGPLWSYTLRLTHGDRGRAEDIVQETLIRAWRNPAALDEQKGSPRAWLFAVARNLVVDDWRARRVRPALAPENAPEPTTEDESDAVLQSLLVEEALARLTSPHREVLLECYFRGSSVAQAAAVLGIPAGTVKSRAHYALHALKLVLEEMGVVM